MLCDNESGQCLIPAATEKSSPSLYGNESDSTISITSATQCAHGVGDYQIPSAR